MMMRLAAFALALALPAAPIAAQEQVDTTALQFALSHPVDNADVVRLPQLGDSVPPQIELRPVEGKPRFGYFYFGGQPVIVDMRTRAIVKTPD